MKCQMVQKNITKKTENFEDAFIPLFNYNIAT